MQKRWRAVLIERVAANSSVGKLERSRFASEGLLGDNGLDAELNSILMTAHPWTHEIEARPDRRSLTRSIYVIVGLG